MQAYVDGKQIQCTDDESENWIDVESPEWDPNYDYRVKPDLTYRPFLNAQECWQEMQRHKPVDTKRGYIREIGDKVWYHPDWMDFGCETCADFGTCRSGHQDKSFCMAAAKCGIGRCNTWQEVRR